ncbi:unnamed protein product (mitochondrion) [Plasmodiophora brassicae]|uniref:TsaA-like domain-containing protein n=1 Tax=Plasmodiophora brassicae TaxID=37360 RepID=A0A3P3YGA7_PLABS|nr:unnamed protein product [Plasmodiophora brassicae]
MRVVLVAACCVGGSVLSAALFIAANRLWKRCAQAEKQAADLQVSLKKERRKRFDERVGRTKAERLVRELRLQTNPAGIASLKPIGVLQSVFRDRRGTPRQSLLVPHARARLTLNVDVQGKASLEGLSEFSHVWLIGTFHENTDGGAASRFKAKVAPPRLNGAKVGVFATRSPHRPVPLSLTVARLDAVVDGTLWLSGADLLDGTPILDVKPYVARYDSIPGATCPEWVGDLAVGETAGVLIEDDADRNLSDLVASMQFYDDADDAQRPESRNESFCVRLDRLIVRYTKEPPVHSDHLFESAKSMVASRATIRTT